MAASAGATDSCASIQCMNGKYVLKFGNRYMAQVCQTKRTQLNLKSGFLFLPL